MSEDNLSKKDGPNRRDILKKIGAGAFMIGSVGLGSTPVAGEPISEKTNVSVQDFQQLEDDQLNRDRRLIQRQGTIRMFEHGFADRDIVYQSISGLKVVTDDEEINNANPRLLILGYAEQGLNTAKDEIPDGDTAMINVYVEDHNGTSKVVSAAPYIAEEQPSLRDGEKRTYQMKTFEHPGDGAVTAESRSLSTTVIDETTVSSGGQVAGDGVSTQDTEGDLIKYICGGTCIPMVNWICERSTGSVDKEVCVDACWEFIEDIPLLAACGAVCYILVEYINEKGCISGAGTICTAFCSQV
ncbi:hypothetical protein ELS19_17005 [Halogeometricum borinquense]|uniref:Uncharacterized protein n=1 Tax=Halogeometricum borinquense TaxID=60847 RepID=A0A482T8M0_9EURY|nr:hypothetical protein [Halogeometricum borinquense]RYJ08259.1 hypothetical protein ELS19_17005 [Halogeometricum borinquense]